jgi:hypothetical protein
VQNRKRVRDEMKVVDAEIKAHTAALALATSTADMDRLRALIYSLNSLRAVLDMNQNVCKLLCNGLYGVMASPLWSFSSSRWQSRPVMWDVQRFSPSMRI